MGIVVCLFMGVFIKIISAYGMEGIKEPLLKRTVMSSPPFLIQLPEVRSRIYLSLDAIQDAVALAATCKRLYKSVELKNLTTFAKDLALFQKILAAESPFFNDEQQGDIKYLVDIHASIRASMKAIVESGKFYEKDGVMPSWATLYNTVRSDYLAFESDLKDSSHPFFEKIKSLKGHNLILFPQEEAFLNDVVIDLGGTVVQEDVPLLHRIIHTMGRNKKIVALGTLTLGAIGIWGTYYLMQYPPFDAQAFVKAYDSTQTGQAYTHYSYKDFDFPYTIAQNNWCLPNGLTLYWDGDLTPPCYYYVDPNREPPHSDSGWLTTVCNKTTWDAATFLYERCGFNKDFWGNLLYPFNNISYGFSGDGKYCNLHSPNKTLVCAHLNGWRQRAHASSICEISLAGAEHYYNHYHAMRAGLYGGVMGISTFAFFALMVWSWYLG